MKHEHTIDVLRELGEYLPKSGMRERLALLALAEAGESVAMGHLAKRIGMSPGAMTSCADNLESRGVIERVRGADRRIVYLQINARGIEIVEAATSDANEVAA